MLSLPQMPALRVINAIAIIIIGTRAG